MDPHSEQNSLYPLLAAVSLLIVLLTIVVCGYAFHWEWTGLVKKNQSGRFVATKYLWDWLQLLVVPIVLAIVAAGFTWAQQRRDRKEARDRLQDAVFTEYVGFMKDLLLHENLRGSAGEAEVRKLAKAYTKAALEQLHGTRKGRVMWFLSETRLLQDGVFDLGGARLSGAKLDGIDLHGANLSWAHLCDAVLQWAKLEGINLNNAKLGGADLRWANLTGADLSNAKLSRADLRSATLHGAKFFYPDRPEQADLSKADLRQADLDKAVVTDEGLKAAALDGAVMPDGRTFSGWVGQSYETETVKQWRQNQQRAEGETAKASTPGP